MENKKCCRQAIYGVLSALVIVVLLCMFIFPSVGLSEINIMVKDHGSLIAGLIGFAGVVVLVLVQKQSTKEMVDATLKVIQIESKELDRKNFLSTISRMIRIINSIKVDDIFTTDQKYKEIKLNIDNILSELTLIRFIKYSCVDYRVKYIACYIEFVDFMIDVFCDEAVNSKDGDNVLNAVNRGRVRALHYLNKAADEQLAHSELTSKADYDELRNIFNDDIIRNDKGQIIDTSKILQFTSKIYTLSPILDSIGNNIKELKVDDI